MTNPFNTPNQPLLGRSEELESLWSTITGTHNISLVAPKRWGKTALLREIERRAKDSGKFEAVMFWDLKDGNDVSTPEAFWKNLATKLWDSWTGAGDYYGISGEDFGGSVFLDIANDLQADSKHLLFLWRGFDIVLRNEELSQNFMGQLTSLFGSGGVRGIISTRRPMEELVLRQADTGSDLFRRFTIQRCDPFADKHLNELAKCYEKAGKPLEPAALKEVAAQTGGLPPLVFDLLASIWDTSSDGSTVTKLAITAAADKTETTQRELWATLSSDAKKMAVKIAQCEGGLPAEGISASHLEELKQGHLLVRKNHKLRLSASVLETFARGQDAEGGELAVLFGHPAHYRKNIAQALQHRRKTVKRSLTPELARSIEKMLTELEDSPETALDSARRVFSGSADVLLKELFPDGTVPKDVISKIKAGGKRLPHSLENGSQVPRSKGDVCCLLDRLQELKLLPQPQALPLLKMLNDAGDVANHEEDHGPVTEALAVAAATVAVELLLLLDLA